MIRSDLANKLAAKMNISKQEADRTLLAFINGIMTNLEKDGRVVIQGFGSFRLKEYEARIGKKPVTGEPIQIPARKKAGIPCQQGTESAHQSGTHRASGLCGNGSNAQFSRRRGKTIIVKRPPRRFLCYNCLTCNRFSNRGRFGNSQTYPSVRNP